MFQFRDLFNFKSASKIADEEPDKNETLLTNTEEPEAIEIEENNLTWGMNFDYSVKNIQHLVLLYRSATQNFEIDDAIEEIVNEAIVTDEGDILTINTDELDFSDAIKKKIKEEFEGILRMMEFKKKAQEYFRKWYVDGRIFFQNVVNEKKEKEGITKLVNLSPLDIIRVKQVDPKDEKKRKNIFLYRENDEYVQKKRHTIHKWSDDYGYEVPEELITFIPSGLTDPHGDYYISHLHKALKPLNQLRLLEDSAVIYRISRAPERRVFYIDVGKLPKTKAEEYVKKLMNKFKNKISYDATTGKLTQSKDVMTMLEDFYLPTTSDQKGTKVDVLQGGQQLGEIDDIIYFKKKLYKSLKVPTSRIDDDAAPTVDFGRAGEITRQELKFTKFVRRLRSKFSELFLDILKKQLIMKGIINKNEWAKIKDDIEFVWASDSYFTELKENEILKERLSVIEEMQDHIGKYFSNDWIRKRVLRFDDDEIESMQKEIDEETKSGEISNEEEEEEM